VVVDAGAAVDGELVLATAAKAARRAEVIERASLERLAKSGSAAWLTAPWPESCRWRLVELLSTGPAAAPVIESLDQRGLWAALLPDTPVERRWLDAVARAAPLAHRVARPDLLMVAALVHAMPPPGPRQVSERIGLSEADAEVVARLAEHHRLLADVATRRDVEDPRAVERVAAAMGSAEHLALQAALTEALADADWRGWRADAVATLVERAAHVLNGAAHGPVDEFPPAALRDRMTQSGRHIDVEEDPHGDVVTVVADDRPGVFSRVAGALALHGLDVLTASAYSSEGGRAVNQFRVADRFRTETPWPRVVADIERALDGRLAIDARLSDRARTYSRRGAGASVAAVATTVSFDVDGSHDWTIIDVHTADSVGVLFRITRALADLDLDIRSARVHTMGDEVVDAFYVRGGDGHKVVDPDALAEIERAVVHSMSSG
jgi:[protein-PII] uridylyltransferase